MHTCMTANPEVATSIAPSAFVEPAAAASATLPAAIVACSETAVPTAPVKTIATEPPRNTPAALSELAAPANEWETGFEDLYGQQWIDVDTVRHRIDRARRAEVDAQFEKDSGGYVELGAVRDNGVSREDYLNLVGVDVSERDIEREFEEGIEQADRERTERDATPCCAFVRSLTRRMREKVDLGYIFLRQGRPLGCLKYMLF